MTSAADLLNRDCACLSLDRPALEALLDRGGVHGLYGSILAKQPHLFSSVAVYLSRAHVDAIGEAVAAIERTVALPAYVEAAIVAAPASATHDFGPRGVFYGYDFHLGDEGPKLIEINTNAGARCSTPSWGRRRRRAARTWRR